MGFKMQWVDGLARNVRVALVAATTGMFAGCSIQPLPEDVTALDTKSIVRKINCEAQDSLKYQVKKLILGDRTAPQRLKDLWIRNLYEDVGRFSKLKDDHRFEDRTRLLLEKYSKYLLYLDCTFIIYEENKNSTDINLADGIVLSQTSFNIKTSNDRKRQNTSNFRVRKTFQQVISSPGCGQFSTLPDPIYPITGEIGMSEAIDDFLELNEYDSLSANPGKDKIQLFSRTLQFTTLNSGTAGPKITLSSLGKAMQLANAGLISTSTRSDVHEVLIGMALPSEDPKDPAYIASRLIVPGGGFPPATEVIRSRNLDIYMDEQQRRNILLDLGSQRAAALGGF
ncbi:hypothetical protein E4V01_24180 [Methylorubrum sp. Q1]|uniref:hypothetical protein n=1 Tax=Methylorubrum sp. Q1 TaxID=2562453 RepID=UPI0010768051|nr:hypothetical protein [Methylorubrum sp. Q1]TFZ54959.1 hypothetical protein E4V01_24180 [Methylorubrum sp. Q1]